MSVDVVEVIVDKVDISEDEDMCVLLRRGIDAVKDELSGDITLHLIPCTSRVPNYEFYCRWRRCSLFNTAAKSNRS